MSMIYHNTFKGKAIYIQAIRIWKATDEDMERVPRRLRGKWSRNRFKALRGHDILLQDFDTKNKIIKAVYDGWGCGKFVLIGRYVNNYGRSKRARSTKSLATVFIKDTDEGLVGSVTNLNRMRKSCNKWFRE